MAGLIDLGGIRYNLLMKVSGHRDLFRLSGGLKGVKRDTGGLITGFGNLNTASRVAAEGLRTVVTALGAAAFGRLAVQSALLAGRVENLRTVLDNVGRTAGYSNAEIRQLEQGVVSLGITLRQSREALALMAQNEMDLENATKLARIAQDAAVIAGVNSSDAFERVTIAIQRNNTWMLRNLGILINLQNLYQRYAAETGRVVNTLSSWERQQLLLSEVVRKGALIVGTYEAAMTDVYKQYTSLNRVIEEARRALGEQYLPIFEDVVVATTKSLKWWTALDDKWQALAASGITLTVALLGLAAAIGVVTTAWGALNLSLAFTHPALLTIIGILAGLAAAYVGVRAALLAGDRAAKEHREEMEKQVVVAVKLAETYRHLRAAQAEGVGNLTVRQLRDVDTAMSKAILTCEDYSSALLALKDDIGAFADKLAEISEGVTRTAAESVTELEDRMWLWYMMADKTMQQIQRTRAEVEGLDKRGVELLLHPRTTVLEREIEALWAGFVEQMGMAKELRAEADMYRKQEQQAAYRHYVQMGKETTTAHQLALRQLRLFQTRRKNMWDNANLEILKEYGKVREQLSEQYFTPEEIEAFTAGFLESAYAGVEATIKKQREAGQLAEKDVADVRARGRAAARERTADFRRDLEEVVADITRAFRESQELFEHGMAEEERATEHLASALEDLVRGVAVELTEMDQELAGLREKMLVTEREFLKGMEELEDERRIAQREYTADLAMGDKAVARKRLNDTERHLANAERAYDNFRRAYFLQEEKLTRELIALRQKLTKELLEEERELAKKRAAITGEQLLTTLEGVRDALEGMRGVEEFLQDCEWGTRKFGDSMRDLRDTMEGFLDTIGQAASEKQLDRLLSVYPEKAIEAFQQLTERIREVQEAYAGLPERHYREEIQDIQELNAAYMQMVRSGVYPSAAQRDVQAEFGRRQRGRFIEQMAVEEELRRLQREKEELWEAEVKGVNEIKKAVEERRDVLGESVDLVALEAELQKEALSVLDQQIEKNQRLQEVYNEQLDTLREMLEVQGGKSARGDLVPRGRSSFEVLQQQMQAPLDRVPDIGAGMLSSAVQQRRMGQALEKHNREVSGALTSLRSGFQAVADATVENSSEIAEIRTEIDTQVSEFSGAFADKGLG